MDERIRKIIKLLEKNYPDASTALKNWRTPWQMLVSTMLSAQCTDKRVNEVTKKLFEKYPDVKDYANLPQDKLESEIYSTGFYKNKARNIIACAQKILSMGGAVPDTMEGLLSLPGVARKTANVVLENAFGKSEGITVDTHVRRLSRRLGLSNEDSPEKIEKDLMKIVPRKLWRKFSYLLIEHGRKVCHSRNPLCKECFLKKFCLYKFPPGN